MAESLDTYFSGVIGKDFLHMVVGKEIGSGAGRKVFEWLPDPTLVVKVETVSQSFQNIMEWETWQRVHNVKSIHKWFAPCVKISMCGTVLLQKRTSLPGQYPKQVPAWFTDIKKENYGMFNGHFVAHDYGIHLMMENGMTKRMKKATWE